MPRAMATPAQQRILSAKAQNPDHNAKELAKDLGISEQAVRTQMTRLRKAGLIPGNGRRKGGRPRRPIVSVPAVPYSTESVTALPTDDAGLPFAKEVVTDQLGHVETELAQVEETLTTTTARKEQLESDRDRLRQAQIALGSPEGAVLRHLPRTAGKRK